jgi:hypothetical protein
VATKTHAETRVNSPHQPLSESLKGILGRQTDSEKLTLNLLLKKTEGRGLYLVLILLSILAVGLPGVSVPLGVVLMLLSLALAFERSPHLPKFLGDRSLPKSGIKTVLRASVRILRLIEKMVKPRRTPWMAWRVPKMVNGLIMAWMAFLLALPLPPVPVPFTNFFPGYSIVLVAVSMMEEDGVMIWVGYAAAGWTTFYFIFFFGLISATLVRLIHSM